MKFDITTVIAVWGAVTGTAGLIILWLTYRRDNADVRVTLMRGMTVSQGPAGDVVVRRRLAALAGMGMTPPMSLYLRDPDKKWASLTITNYGRRSVSIAKIAWVGPTGTFHLPAGYYSEPGYLPVEVTGGNSRAFSIEEGNLADGVLAAVVWDGAGRGYYGAFEGSWRGLILWVRVIFHIRPYS